MAIDFKAIERLPPQDRVKVLKELEAQLKKQQVDIKKDLEDVAEALVEAQQAAHVIERIATPPVIASPETVEEKVEREEKISELEKAAQAPTPQQIHNRLHQQTTEEIYKRLSSIFYETQIQKQEPTTYQEHFVEAAQKEIYERKTEEYKARSDLKSDEFLSDSEKLVKYLRK